jgi:hypothetical protein
MVSSNVAATRETPRPTTRRVARKLTLNIILVVVWVD